MPALLYGLFACYAVTGKCDLRIDSEGHDIPVFASLEDCQRFGSASAREPPDREGKWTADEGHYYRCFGMTPMSVAALGPPAVAPRPVYQTTAEALERDFRTNPDALAGKIGSAMVEVKGTVENAAVADGAALQLSGDKWDVTAWLTKDGIAAARAIRKHEQVTLRCDRIGTLIAASGRRAAVVEVRGCTPVKPEG
ncbi:MAG TPA: hypothetical protein VGR86_16210 [Steroidobacteraceae bacterium]|nr:hypothetical protein [Steroidobacteraceae bacterium]